MEHSLPRLVGKVSYSPKSMNILRISHGNVARHSFTVAFASEDAKGQCHVFEHPLAMLSKGNKGGDSRETDALTDHFEGSFLLLLCLLCCCCVGGNCIVVIIVLILLLLLLLFIALNCLAHDANGGIVMLRSCQCCRSHDLIYKYRDIYCSQKDEDEEETEEISRLEKKTRKDQSKTLPVP